MRGRHSDTVDPVCNTTALGTDIAQDSPDGYCAQNNSNCQDDHKLWNFRCFLIEQHKQSPFPGWGIEKDGLVRPRREAIGD